MPLQVPGGTPLAGYGSLARRRFFPAVFGGGPAFWFKASTGTLDSLSVRALVLEDDAVRLVWVALDVVAVDRPFTERVRTRIGGPEKPATVLLVSASHTHSGPGAFLESRLMGIVAADRLNRDVREAMLAAVGDAVTRARERLVPARVGTASVQGAPLVKSRLGQPLDVELVVMKIVSVSGAPIALLWNHAIHGTMLGPANLAFSGDVMGLASQALERELGVPALFVNGALADVSPGGHGRQAAIATGLELARAVSAAWNRLRAEDSPTLAVRTVPVALPAPSVSLRNCASRWLPRALRLPLDGALPGSTELTAAALGDTVWVTVPGELESRLGLTLKAVARPTWQHAFVAGVTNDYLGYFVSAETYDRPGYVTCASLYGREGGDRITALGSDLLRGLAGLAPGKGVR